MRLFLRLLAKIAVPCSKIQLMPTYPIVQLKQGKESALERFHPWVFSGAIATIEPGLKPGTVVSVLTSAGRKMGTAFFEGGSIALKMISFDSNEQIDTGFWNQKILKAWRLREQLGLTHSQTTNMFRLVHSEGDHLPGLIVDVYGNTAVVQAQSAGIASVLNEIAESLMMLPDNRIQSVYNKSEAALAKMGVTVVSDGYLAGSKIETECVENGLRFFVDWEIGQKTGFFIDQRENRRLLESYCNGKKVLNAFSYSGGFSVAALRAGASKVVSVDSSKQAIELCRNNITLNKFDHHHHEEVLMDAKKYLAENGEEPFDIIVLDPPAFAKNMHNRHKGLEGYRYINFLALKYLAKGGLLFTFSCSQAVDHAAFRGAVMSAAVEARRNVRIIHQPVQPADHPVNVFHPEGFYLKGLVLTVD